MGLRWPAIGLAVVWLAIAPISPGASTALATDKTLPTGAAIEDVVGRWMTQGAKAIVEIERCGEEAARVCGRIVWTWKRPEFLGRTILSGFAWDGRRWAGGRLFDPEDAKSYRGRLELTDEAHLKVQGCLFLFCRSETWFRPHIMPPPGP